ncbi:hypothetical protein JB92DRAFT_2827150 [Gautieria morchelliformis]|nr:hypothetical protein JB92DRAFT_2827150 [Gautieria morchelliformis]
MKSIRVWSVIPLDVDPSSYVAAAVLLADPHTDLRAPRAARSELWLLWWSCGNVTHTPNTHTRVLTAPDEQGGHGKVRGICGVAGVVQLLESLAHWRGGVLDRQGGGRFGARDEEGRRVAAGRGTDSGWRTDGIVASSSGSAVRRRGCGSVRGARTRAGEAEAAVGGAAGRGRRGCGWAMFGTYWEAAYEHPESDSYPLADLLREDLATSEP